MIHSLEVLGLGPEPDLFQMGLVVYSIPLKMVFAIVSDRIKSEVPGKSLNRRDKLFGMYA
jgi:hypothetical protein